MTSYSLLAEIGIYGWLVADNIVNDIGINAHAGTYTIAGHVADLSIGEHPAAAQLVLTGHAPKVKITRLHHWRRPCHLHGSVITENQIYGS